MDEFENADLSQWLRDGLVIRARPRVRRFSGKRSGAKAFVVMAVAAMAVTASSLITAVSSTQIQDHWALTALMPTAPPPDTDLLRGPPATHWSSLMAAVSSWPDLPDDVPIDVPPLV